MKILFFIFILSAWFGAHLYVYRRTVGVLRPRPNLRFAFAALMVLMSVAWPLSRMLSRLGDNIAVRFFQGSGSVWMGFIVVLIMMLVALDLLVLLPVWAQVRCRRLSRGLLVPVRRLTLVTAVVLAVVVSGLAVHNALGPVTVTSLEVESRDLDPSLDGYTLLLLSDIHQGSLVGVDDIDRIEDAVRSVDFDIILFAGDLTDEENGGDGQAFRRFASWRSLGSSGVALAVSGNHERYSGGDKVLGLMVKSGITVLRQGHFCTLDGLCIAGVDDPAMLPEHLNPADAIDRALVGIPEKAFTVLLSHQPINVERAARNGVDLMLSGHTHHGQFPPATFFTPLVYPYWAGSYQIEDMFLHVTSGAGFWGPPLRLGSRSEIVRIVLKRIG